MKKVLILSHDAYYGAPSVLFDLCQAWFDQHVYEMKFVFLGGGALLERFRGLGEVVLFSNYKFSGIRGSLKFLRDRLAITSLMKRWKPDLIYANTIATTETLCFFEKFHCPVIQHIHEMEPTIRHFVSTSQQAWNISRHFVAASDAVKSDLIKQFEVPSEKVTRVYEGIDLRRIQSALQKKKDDAANSEYEFTVGSAGGISWRKGTDLWLQIALQVSKMMPSKKIRFVWVGKDWGSFSVKKEIELLGLRNVFFVGEQENPYPIYNNFDVFLLPSREDPCPLVMLENLYLKKPVIYFQKSGGAAEVVKNDAGISISNQDTAKTAEVVCALLSDPERRKEMGEAGHARVKAQHDIREIAENIRAIINKAI